MSVKSQKRSKRGNAGPYVSGSRGAHLTLTTDNGTQFNSSRFLENADRLWITHRRTTYTSVRVSKLALNNLGVTPESSKAVCA